METSEGIEGGSEITGSGQASTAAPKLLTPQEITDALRRFAVGRRREMVAAGDWQRVARFDAAFGLTPDVPDAKPVTQKAAKPVTQKRGAAAKRSQTQRPARCLPSDQTRPTTATRDQSVRAAR